MVISNEIQKLVKKLNLSKKETEDNLQGLSKWLEVKNNRHFLDKCKILENELALKYSMNDELVEKILINEYLETVFKKEYKYLLKELSKVHLI